MDIKLKRESSALWLVPLIMIVTWLYIMAFTAVSEKASVEVSTNMAITITVDPDMPMPTETLPYDIRIDIVKLREDGYSEQEIVDFQLQYLMDTHPEIFITNGGK